MARYFFHLEDGNDEVLRDDTGEEFSEIEEAKNHALDVASELGRNQPKSFRAQQRLLVTDEAGIALFRFPLSLLE